MRYSNNISTVEVYNVPIEKVWQAITDVDQMREWYYEQLNSFKPETWFSTSFVVTIDDREFTHVWKVYSVTPLKSLSYNWTFKEYQGSLNTCFVLEIRELKLY